MEQKQVIIGATYCNSSKTRSAYVVSLEKIEQYPYCVVHYTTQFFRYTHFLETFVNMYPLLVTDQHVVLHAKYVAKGGGFRIPYKIENDMVYHLFGNENLTKYNDIITMPYSEWLDKNYPLEKPIERGYIEFDKPPIEFDRPYLCKIGFKHSWRIPVGRLLETTKIVYYSSNNIRQLHLQYCEEKYFVENYVHMPDLT